MKNKCKFCIHRDVCRFRNCYEDAVKHYEKIIDECDKYPYFKCNIECVQYYKKDNYYDNLTPRSVENDNT